MVALKEGIQPAVELDTPQAIETAPLNRELPYPWLKPADIGLVFDEADFSVSRQLITPLMDQLKDKGNRLFYPLYHDGKSPQESFLKDPEILITTVPFGRAVERGLLFSAKTRFGLKERQKRVITLVGISRENYQRAVGVENKPGYFARLRELSREQIEKEAVLLVDNLFPGLPETAALELYDQAKRAGDLTAFGRQLQAQAQDFDVVAAIGEPAKGKIDFLIYFNLVGGRKIIPFDEPYKAAEELVLRLMTAWSAKEARNHMILPDTLSENEWQQLLRTSGKTLREAGQAFGQRGLFFRPIDIKKLTRLPLNGAIAELYSEGCMGLYDEDFGVWVMTPTGIRENGEPVDKGNLREGEFVVVTGVKPEHDGVMIIRRPHEKDLPEKEVVKSSSEGLDMLLMGAPFAFHTHMAAVSYNPQLVETLGMPEVYNYFPPDCGTVELAEANAQTSASSRDPHFKKFPVKFFNIIGHGVFILADSPWRIIEFLDRGDLVLSTDVPQEPYLVTPTPPLR